MTNEQLLDLAALLLILPRRRGKRPHRSTIFRWCNRGIKTPDGIVRLEFVKIGGGLFFSREAVDEFISALSVSKRAGIVVAGTRRSPHDRNAAATAAAEAINARYPTGATTPKK